MVSSLMDRVHRWAVPSASSRSLSWQQQALCQVFGVCAQEGMEKGLSVPSGAAPACVPAVEGLILPNGHLLPWDRGTSSPGIRHCGRCCSSAALAHAALPSAPRLSPRTVDRALQAEVPQVSSILHPLCGGLLLHRWLSFTASDFKIKFYFLIFGRFSPANFLLK